MNKMHRSISLLTQMAVVTIGLFALQGSAIAADEKISEVLGDYEIFTSNNAANHEAGRLLIMLTEKGSGADPDTFGLAWVSNKTGGKGVGLACPEAVLLPGNEGISCSKEVRNPAGKIIFVETLTVAVTGSTYCTAIKNTLPPGQQNKVVDASHADCDEADEQCICYDIRHRGNSPAGPPSQGTGSGKRGG